MYDFTAALLSVEEGEETIDTLTKRSLNPALHDRLPSYPFCVL